MVCHSAALQNAGLNTEFKSSRHKSVQVRHWVTEDLWGFSGVITALPWLPKSQLQSEVTEGQSESIQCLFVDATKGDLINVWSWFIWNLEKHHNFHIFQYSISCYFFIWDLFFFILQIWKLEQGVICTIQFRYIFVRTCCCLSTELWNKHWSVSEWSVYFHINGIFLTNKDATHIL